MEMARWVRTISKYQTANLLTPLPVTSNWSDLVPLDANGDILASGEMRPYHLYTGRQFVHKDERWTMKESQDLFNKYSEMLNPVDNMYARLFRISDRYRSRLKPDLDGDQNKLPFKHRDLSILNKELDESIKNKNKSNTGAPINGLADNDLFKVVSK